MIFFQHPARVSPIIATRQDHLPKEITDIAWKAQLRLNAKFKRLLARLVLKNKAVVAVARELVAGLKGMAAYMDHAMILGRSNDDVMAFFQRALVATTDANLGLMDFVGLSMECGKHNLTEYDWQCYLDFADRHWRASVP